MLTDSFNRKIDYLRLSLTDRCNLRCVYCMPKDMTSFGPREEMLSDAEILKLLSCFAQLGISKIRITGGEPLVREGIVSLVREISGIRGIQDISLSTNGLLLDKMALDLTRAGLKRVNISLDSLNAEKFNQITRYGKLETVLSAIESALSAGLAPVKLNVVVARGMNDDEIADFVKLTKKNPLHVRFIELMPMGETGFFSKEKWVSMNEILQKAQPLEEMEKEDWPRGEGPARYFRRPGARGTIGVISALSCGFCSSCNRMRLSSQGVLVPCLDAAEGTDLKALLRSGTSSRELKEAILFTVQQKPERHHMLEKAAVNSSNPRQMCQIGG
ncbi:MAG: cyclic pyranopterin phosphate synthase MoaA [Elusimicrobia bacterium RIFCSPLOWO2_01_FULL_54_10]|nr:MAG: cyclic pyranopterin phosphate synthase MoaA [Elusimicrobia bacterium RIFCSPLOWO2_01_FULL_54_10]